MLLSRADGATAGFGLPVAFGLLLRCEAGVPVPVPAYILMIAIGGVVSAGTLTTRPARLGPGPQRARATGLPESGPVFGPKSGRPYVWLDGAGAGL